jgi:hypothetical protein
MTFIYSAVKIQFFMRSFNILFRVRQVIKNQSVKFNYPFVFDIYDY